MLMLLIGVNNFIHILVIQKSKQQCVFFYNCSRINRKTSKMSEHLIALVNDHQKIAEISSHKVLVAVPLFYVFMTHYLFQILRFVKGEHEKAERLNDLGKRLFLYGVAALFSMNFLQCSIMMAIMAWAVLLCVVVIHCFVFIKETDQKYHNNGLLVYYGLLMIWFISIIFFYIYNASSMQKSR